MVTAGLDKRIVFFDITSGVVVKSIDVPNPASAMTLHSDGVTMAVGSTRGEIMVFDLRNGSIPKASLVLKSTDSINYLEFDHPSSKHKVRVLHSGKLKIDRNTQINTTPSALGHRSRAIKFWQIITSFLMTPLY